MKQYSFLNPIYLEENKKKSTLAAILAALGIFGTSNIPMPASYVQKTGAKNFGQAVMKQALTKPKYPLEFSKNFSKGMRDGMDILQMMNPQIKKQKKFGDAVMDTIKGKRNIVQNMIDVEKGNIEL